MNLRLSFSLVGLCVFLFPMFINVAYVLFPPRMQKEDTQKERDMQKAGDTQREGNIQKEGDTQKDKAKNTTEKCRFPEAVEAVSRIVYLLFLVFLVSGEPLRWESAWLYVAIGFLVLYYAVWIRYFAGGRRTELLGASFLFVPVPLAVFPVLYFFCAACRMHNPAAVLAAAVFGVAHITVTVRAFRRG